MSTTHAIITIDIVLDRHNCREVLRALLHGILFHRLFGTVKPQTFEVLDVTIPGVADPEIERLVTEKVDALWRAMENGSHRRGQLSVTFSKKDQKKSWIGITYEEEVPWEQWLINTEIRQPTSEQGPFLCLFLTEQNPYWWQSVYRRAHNVQPKPRLDAYEEPAHDDYPHVFRTGPHRRAAHHKPEHIAVSDEDWSESRRRGDWMTA